MKTCCCGQELAEIRTGPSGLVGIRPDGRAHHCMQKAPANTFPVKVEYVGPSRVWADGSVAP